MGFQNENERDDDAVEAPCGLCGEDCVPCIQEGAQLIFSGRKGTLWLRPGPVLLPLLYIPYDHISRCVEESVESLTELRAIVSRLEHGVVREANLQPPFNGIEYTSRGSASASPHRFFEITLPLTASMLPDGCFASFSDRLKTEFRQLHPCPEKELPIASSSRFWVSPPTVVDKVALRRMLGTKATVKDVVLARGNGGRPKGSGHVKWDRAVPLSPVRCVFTNGKMVSIHFK